MTQEELDRRLIDLVPSLARFVPPATVIDKKVIPLAWLRSLPSPHRPKRQHRDCVRRRDDVCVLTTVLGAIDGGFRVIIASDALCSSADSLHDAILKLYGDRFNEQVEVVTTEIIVSSLARPEI